MQIKRGNGPKGSQLNLIIDENLTQQAHLVRNPKNCKNRSEKIRLSTKKLLKLHTVKLVIDEELTEESIFRNLRSVTFDPGRLDLDRKEEEEEKER